LNVIAKSGQRALGQREVPDIDVQSPPSGPDRRCVFARKVNGGLPRRNPPGYSSTPQPSRPIMRELLTIKTKSGTQQFDVEVVRAQDDQEAGLMGREHLPPRHGMLFLEDREKAKRMWMKGTPLPLDMLFIKKDGLIHRIEREAVPNSEKMIWSGALVIAVLEIGGGVADRFGIREGDSVALPKIS
jgi:uncharacterized membrane protein (UPF0127 family)